MYSIGAAGIIEGNRNVEEFRLRPLHRQRTRRRATRSVLDENELAHHFGVALTELKAALERAGWDYHEDAAGRFWASVPHELLDKREP